MKTDVAFQIGKTHDVCEDYALSGVFDACDEAFYTVVSDGCSSSPNTDLGARVLSHSIVSELKNLYRNSAHLMFNFNDDACMAKARSSIESLDISSDSLDATALIALSDDYSTEIIVKGDGCVAIGFHNKKILVINFEFPHGYPFYMNYLPTYSLRYQGWAQLNQEDLRCNVTCSVINADGTIEELDNECSPLLHYSADKKSVSINAKKNYYGGEIYYFTDDDKKKKTPPEFIVLMSDGISSFYKTEDTGTSLTNSNIDYRDVIAEALSFKNFNGKFMQRRLNRFLKFCQKNNWHHADDISFGAIYFGDK